MFTTTSCEIERMAKRQTVISTWFGGSESVLANGYGTQLPDLGRPASAL